MGSDRTPAIENEKRWTYYPNVVCFVKRPIKHEDRQSSRKCKTLDIIPNMWYILDTSDHECHLHECVSKPVWV